MFPMFKTTSTLRIDDDAELTVEKDGYGLRLTLEDKGCNKVSVFLVPRQVNAVAEFLNLAVKMPQDYTYEGDE